MTKATFVHSNKKGFTLIETIIYIGLFGIMFTGIFVSVYPLFTGAERLTRNILIEGETAFVLAKIDHALAASVTKTGITISTGGALNDELIIKNAGGSELYHFKEDTSGTFCTPPLACKMFVMSKNGGSYLPLNSQRVQFTDLSVIKTGSPMELSLSFKANGEEVGPVRYNLHF